MSKEDKAELKGILNTLRHEYVLFIMTEKRLYVGLHTKAVYSDLVWRGDEKISYNFKKLGDGWYLE